MSEFQDQKNLLEKLRASDDATKKRWLIVLSGVSMAVIIFVWLSYFNHLVMERGNAPAVEEEIQEAAAPSFIERVRGGMASLGRFTKGIFEGLSNMLAAPRSYIIEPSE